MKRVIMFLVIVMFVFSATTYSADKNWINEVRTGKSAATSQNICKNLERFYEKDKIPDKTLAIMIAKDLMSTFNLPYQTRFNSEPCTWETKYYVDFSDSLSMMEGIIALLDRSGATPHDMNYSPAKLRATLLKNLKEQFFEIRKMVQEGRASRSDIYQSLLIEVATRAHIAWGFTYKELGLTSNEITLVQKNRE